MNKEYLQQRLAEMSGTARAIYTISEDEAVGALATHLEDYLDGLIVQLRDYDECGCDSIGPAHVCPGCGCPSHDRCHGCGQFHD